MIHKFKFDDKKIVLDVNSGAVHVVDDVTWDVLDYYEKYAEKDRETVRDLVLRNLSRHYKNEELLEVINEIEDLIEQGLLFSADSIPREYSLPENPVVKSLCLHVAHDCNLRCKYCFAGTGHFGGEKGLMPFEVGKAAIDFLVQSSQRRKHCEIDFFGGEPLLNMDVVKQIVHYGREQGAKHDKEFKFTLTTNAVRLDAEIINYLNDNDIAVVLSLDGRPEVNDRMRLTPAGKGSYHTITHKIKEMVQSRHNENYYVRGTFTRFNLDFAADVLHLVDDLGFKHVSVEPVVAGAENDYAFREEDLPVLFAEYEKLTRSYLEHYSNRNEFNFFHFNLELEHGPCLPKRLSGCGAGHEYLAVTPEGDLYPCHQFVGRREYRLGTVFDGIFEDRRHIMKQFQQAHIYNKQKCRECWAKFFCSGGCHANAHAFNGTLLEPYDIGCQLEKKRVECAIYIQVKKMKGEI
ncbi:radical SAM protein [Thermincola ferriacetica]|uniref:Radical SAM protein n=1 Tax=Thermincola ferriacetica TaxID=281456 RepID=A0A0L6W2E6_9FIRM|nr:thioether cross-link-forming SCIFF peptide maturase [Thermincola ferriacetica]KNZ69752.1 radical SAM protein [Thermincola ferriacetica]